MKRVLPLLLLLAVLVAACFGAGVTARADEAIAQQYVTERYYDLGDVYAISAYHDTVAVLRAKDDVAYLTVMGGTQAEVQLSVAPASLEGKRIALYDDKVMMATGDALAVYDCATGIWRNTTVPLSTTDFFGNPMPLTCFDVDENGMVYLSYQITLVRVRFDDVYNDNPFSNVNSTSLSQEDKHYSAFEAHDGVCYFYSAAGAAFSVDMSVNPAMISETRPISAVDDYAFAGKDLYLFGGAVQSTDGAILRADAAHTADCYLQLGTSVCTSYADGRWRVWVVDRGQSAVKVYDNQLQYLYMFGAYGADDGRLHAPTQVSHDKMTVVADSGNHRTVVLREGTYTHIDVDATSVATAGDLVLVAQGEYVYNYDYARPTADAPYTRTPYELTDEVLSVCADGNAIYAQTADHLYMVNLSTTPVAIAGQRIKSGRHTGIVYVQTANSIVEYKDMQSVGVAIDTSALEVVDFDVDYCGNVYVLTADNVLLSYLRTSEGYIPTQLSIAAPLAALSIHADGAVYGLSDSALTTLGLSVRTRANSSYTDPAWDDPVSVVKVTRTVWGYAGPNNLESLVKVPEGTYAMMMATHTYQGTDYYYVEFALSTAGTVRYERVYIPRTAAALVGYTTPTDTYVRYDGPAATTGVYPYPSYSAEATQTIAKADAVFHVLRVMGVEDGTAVWNWYMVEVGDKVAYVAADNYVAAEPPYREVERYYARCVAGKLGEKVNVYVSPDVNSQVVTSLVDGTKVELTAPYDKDSRFTCIRIGDDEVYILTANVTDRALTNGQTFALIMSIVIICAAAVTLVLYLLVKKNR